MGLSFVRYQQGLNRQTTYGKTFFGLVTKKIGRETGKLRKINKYPLNLKTTYRKPKRNHKEDDCKHSQPL